MGVIFQGRKCNLMAPPPTHIRAHRTSFLNTAPTFAPLLRLSYLFLLFALLSAFGCTEYRRVVRSTDLQYKYDKALEYYKAEKYAKAYPLLEELNITYRGTEKGERIAYYRAQCDFNLKDYTLAAHRFEQFYKEYPGSEFAEESHFLSAYCNYKLSPRYNLDQSDTYTALRSYQFYAVRYPESTRMDSVNSLLDEMRGKIEYKHKDRASLYYRMERYRAAKVALDDFLKTYPFSQYAELASFAAFESAAEVAINSVEEKMAERMEEAFKAYATFAARFSESEYAAEAKSIEKNLKQLASQNQKLNGKQ